MSTGELLNVEPVELKFPFELKKQLSCSLQVSNKTENYVAFKVKTTNPKKYCVRPNTGVVLPRSTSDIVVTMQAHEEAPPEMQCSDKFCLQSVIATPGATPKDITSEMFNEEQVKVEECILKVVYIAPRQPPSPVVEGSQEGVSPRYSAAENGNEQDRNGTHAGELFMKGIGIVFLCSIFLYLLMKMLLPLIWSLTFMIIMFVIRMVRRLVSDSIEDWIEKTLFYFCIHFFTVLFQLFRRGESRANNESRVSNAR